MPSARNLGPRLTTSRCRSGEGLNSGRDRRARHPARLTVGRSRARGDRHLQVGRQCRAAARAWRGADRARSSRLGRCRSGRPQRQARGDRARGDRPGECPIRAESRPHLHADEPAADRGTNALLAAAREVAVGRFVAQSFASPAMRARGVPFKKSDQGLRRPGARIREARHPGDHGAAPARPPRPQQGLRLSRKEGHVERSLDPGTEHSDPCERLQPMRTQPTREPRAPWPGTARGRGRRPPRRPWPWPDRDRRPQAAARSLRTRRAGP